MFSLGDLLLVTNIANNKSVVVRCVDKIGKRFAETRIDLSKAAFERIADLDEGVVEVKVEVLKWGN